MTNELRYFTALKKIGSYISPERLRASSEKAYGLTYEEALEMAYENVINEAKEAIYGRRTPKEKANG